jgi:hypothetical protein
MLLTPAVGNQGVVAQLGIRNIVFAHQLDSIKQAIAKNLVVVADCWPKTGCRRPTQKINQLLFANLILLTPAVGYQGVVAGQSI